MKKHCPIQLSWVTWLHPSPYLSSCSTFHKLKVATLMFICDLHCHWLCFYLFHHHLYTLRFHFNLFLFNLHLLYICMFICTNKWFCIFMMEHFKLNDQQTNKSLLQSNAKSTKHVNAHVLFRWWISLLLMLHSIDDDSCTCIISIKMCCSTSNYKPMWKNCEENNDTK